MKQNKSNDDPIENMLSAVLVYTDAELLIIGIDKDDNVMFYEAINETEIDSVASKLKNRGLDLAIWKKIG